MTGSGGGMSIKIDDKVYVAPSGVQKEDLVIQDIFTLSAADKDIIIEPPATKNLKQSACTPLWYEVFKYRPDARSVIHTHSMNAQLVTLMNGDDCKEFKITHFEMLKGVKGHGYEDVLIVPIIDNRPTEDLLADQLGEAVKNYPKTNAVLVRRHGLYVWGNSWQEAKIHAESYDYLFETALKLRQSGVDFTAKPTSSTYNVSTVIGTNKRTIEDATSAAVITKKVHIDTTNGHSTATPATTNNNKYKIYLFDIEGTTTPITFVKDILFPYAASSVQSFLTDTWLDPATQHDVKCLFEQYHQDLNDKNLTKPFVSTLKTLIEGIIKTNNKNEQILWLTEYVQYNIELDRKIGPLKQLQGHIWRRGYMSGTIQGALFPDINNVFHNIIKSNAKIAIYSSGSREAQRLLFQYSVNGDITPYISCYFDTKVGGKREATSYSEIVLSLGVEKPSDILFVTDIIEEAQAAQQAGMYNCWYKYVKSIYIYCCCIFLIIIIC